MRTRGPGLTVLEVEDCLDGLLEQPCDHERQRKARVISACLDGVHGLTRDTKVLSEVALGPTAFGAQIPDGILHLPVAISLTICATNTAHKTLETHAMLKRGHPSSSKK